MKKSGLNVIFLISALTIIAASDFLIVKYSFPIVDGWWEILAYELQSKKLYVDIYIGLAPLYVNSINLLLGLAKNLYEIRLFFLILHIAEFLLLTYFISRFLNLNLAIAGALISELLIIVFNPAYILKDYHLFLQIFINLYFISMYGYLNYKKREISLIFMGGIVGLLLLTKQNIGLLLLFGSLVTIILKEDNLRNKTLELFLILIVTFLVLIAYSLQFGQDWISIYFGNDSKGSLLTILFRSLINSGTSIVLPSIVMGFALFLLNSRYQKLKFISNNYLKYCILIIVAFICVQFSINKSTNFFYILILSIIILNFILFLKRETLNLNLPNIGILSIVLILYAYGNTLTADLNPNGMQILIALGFAYIFEKILKINYKIFFLYFVILILLLITNFYKLKIENNAYSWWGYTISGFKYNTHIPQNSFLDGIKVSHQTNIILEKIHQILAGSKSVYFYPNIPIFYLLENIPIKTKYPISWFDIIPPKLTSDVLSDFDNVDPDFIVQLKMPDFTYEGHYQLMGGKNSVVSAIDHHIQELIVANLYKQVWVYPIFTNVYKYSDNEITVTLYCKLCEIQDNSSSYLDFGVLNIIRDINESKLVFKITFRNRYYFLKFLDYYNPIIVGKINFPILYIYKK